MTIGHTGRLVALEALADELRVPVSAARALTENLSVPLVRIGSREYLSLITLEVELWVATRSPRTPIPETIEELTRAIQQLGYVYAGLTRESVRRRLSKVIAPLKPEDPKISGRPPRGSRQRK